MPIRRHSTSRLLLVSLALALVPTAWLIPNHYPPWVSAWPDGVALALLAGAALLVRAPVRVARTWLLLACLSIASIAVQLTEGRIHFAGDALVATVYIASFILSLAVGGAVVDCRAAGRIDAVRFTNDGVSHFALGTLIAALLCVAVALVQWTDVSIARGWIADLPPRGRPFSNLAQPNHFNTAAFLGIAAAAVLLESGRIGPIGFWSSAAMLLFGMALSGSRTAWVQLAITATMLPFLFHRAGRSGWSAVIVSAGLIAVYAAFLPAYAYMSEWFDREARSITQEVLTSGTRPALWRDMLSAIAHEPWLGHGWLQVGAAQQDVALTRPPYFEQHDHAHNIVLDLLVWAGIPVGATLVVLCASTLIGLFRRTSDLRGAWLLVGAFGLLAHGMLEFPLEYAYFLVPLGISLGMVQSMSGPASAPRAASMIARSVWLAPAGGALLAGLLAVISMDYLKAEENFRLARLQTARIGTDRVTEDVPDLVVLSQLEAFLRFVRTRAKADMRPEDLLWMHAVSERFGTPPVLFRYALALGLNGRHQEAGHTLRLLCQIHAAHQCAEARATWAAMQQQQHLLRAVPVP